MSNDCDFGLVSVVIPAFNAESFLEQAVSSVLSQSYSNLEVIIIVDCSSDQTSSVAETLQLADERIIVKLLPFSCGAAICRNIGIEMASGSFIAFLDADDIWFQDKLDLQLPLFFQQNPPSIVCSAYSCFHQQSNRITNTITGPRKIAYSSILRGNAICTSSVVYDIRHSKVYFPNLPRRQDWGLWMLLLSADDNYAECINKCLVRRCIHSTSLSSNRFQSYWYNYVVLRTIGNLSRVQAFINLLLHFSSAINRRFRL